MATTQKRDELADAIRGWRHAQRAFRLMEQAALEVREGLTDVADAGAVMASRGTAETWAELQSQPISGVGFFAALNFGELAAYLANEDNELPSQSELTELSEKIGAAVEAAGPTDEYRERLNAIWGEDE